MKLFNKEGRIWALAIRPKGKKLLPDGNGQGFVFVKNTFRYWRADPFLFEKDGETYVFAELFDRLTGKGKLGAAKIKNGKIGKFGICLDLPFHLSFPCVFEKDGCIYMIPECGRNGEIALYKCTEFPLGWKKEKIIFKGAGVDTIPILFTEDNKSAYVSTLHLENKNNDNLYYIENGEKTEIITGDLFARSAGRFFEYNGEIIRPSQDCTSDYGKGLQFNRVELKEGVYTEEKICRMYPYEDITVDMCPYKIKGIHTYNKSEKYEIIDVSYDVGVNLQTVIKKFRKFIKRKR